MGILKTMKVGKDGLGVEFLSDSKQFLNTIMTRKKYLEHQINLYEVLFFMINTRGASVYTFVL